MTDETRETLGLMLTNNIVVLDTYPQGHPGRLAYEAIVAALRDVLTPRTCGNCKHLDPENRGTSWGFCGAESDDYGAYPFQGRSMPLDERCKGWAPREDAPEDAR